MIKLSPEEREAKGKAGREKMIRQFDEKIVTAIYLKEIQKVLNQGLFHCHEASESE